MSKPSNQKFKNFFIHLSHSFRRIGNHIKYSTILFYRSKLTIFLFIIYPIILLLLFGSIFVEQRSMIYELQVQDNDSSPLSLELINDLDNTNFLDLKFIDNSVNPKEYLKQYNKYACLVIPTNWHTNSLIYPISNVTLIVTPYSSNADRVIHIIEKTINEFNIKNSGGASLVNVETEVFYFETIQYIDFFLPGIIGVIIMNTGIIGIITRQLHFKKIGILKKFSTMPLTRLEYVLAELLWQFIIAFLVTLLSIFTSWIVFDFSWHSVNAMLLPIIIIGVILFTGLGLLISQLIKNPNNSLLFGMIITIPMLFFSGIFFDVTNNTSLRILSKFSPLTFIVEALRSSMITGNYANAGLNIGIALGIGIVAITFGVLLTKWEKN
ncbi:MAG: ABC transporter permease [Candidatus Heimdallarchaeota archaeon]|nr:ABC transporter permease [Candidatus Heimdallarchaeota archaeon]